jgi:lysylphosphatidylglycerol synthetase-like protein (DUF2156 family)
MTNLSIIRSVAVLLAIFVTGLLAGVMLGVAMAQQTAQKLPEAAWTLRQQNDDALFRKVMPFTFIAMMLLLIASIFLLHGRSRMAMVAATVAALAVIIVTAGWEVPINNEIVKWIPGHAPADWTSTRDKWLQNHLGKNMDRRAGIWMRAPQHRTERLVRGESGPQRLLSPESAKLQTATDRRHGRFNLSNRRQFHSRSPGTQQRPARERK